MKGNAQSHFEEDKIALAETRSENGQLQNTTTRTNVVSGKWQNKTRMIKRC